MALTPQMLPSPLAPILGSRISPAFRLGHPRIGAGGLLLFSFALFLAGCGHKSTSTVSGHVFRIVQPSEPATFDPALCQDVDTTDVLQQVYEGLVQWTTDNQLAPCLATSWTISPDGKVYTFKIRQGVKFHSGKLLTADDVAYTLNRSFEPKLASPVALTYLGDIAGAQDVSSGRAQTLSGVKVLDPETIRITITQPKAYWLNVLTYPTGWVVNKDAVAKDPDGKVTADNEDGTGPFSVAQYVRGDSVDLKAFKDYWGGAPTIDGQHRPIIVNANTRHDLFTTGQIDNMEENPGQIAADTADPVLKTQIKDFPRALTYYVGLNQGVFAPFKDIRVRQALAYATDKQRISQTVYAGERPVAQDLLPPGILASDPNAQGIPYDPAKAKALLAAAGFPGGKGFPPVELTFREGYPDQEKCADLLREMYQENLGITVLPKRTEWASMLNLQSHNHLAMYFNGWSADYLDPQDFYSVLLGTHSPENHVGYDNPTYDGLCRRADVEQTPTQRIALYRQAAKIARQDVPVIPLYYYTRIELVSPRTAGIDDCLMDHLPYKHVTVK